MDMLRAAAQSCSSLRSLALFDPDMHLVSYEQMPGDVSQLSQLTALALHEAKLMGLSQHIIALTAQQTLSISRIGDSFLPHSLSAPCSLHTLQMQQSQHWQTCNMSHWSQQAV